MAGGTNKEVYAIEYQFGGNTEFLQRIEKALANLEKSFSATGKDAQKIGTSIDVSMAKAAKSMDTAAKSSVTLNNSLAGVGAKLKGLVAGFIGFQTISTAISTFAEQETLVANMGVLLGSEKQGADFANYIKRFAESTPYGISDLSSVAKGLLQYNISLEDTKKYMQQLGDIALGDKNKMASLGIAIGQVASAGKLQGQDFMQLRTAGFNPLSILSETSGKTMAQLTKEMSEGKISFEMVADAMRIATSEGGMFFGGMEKGAQTLAGRWSTAMDKVKMSLAEAVEKNQDKLKELVTRIGEFDFSGLIDSAARIGEALLKIGETLVPIIENLAKIPALAEMVIASMAASKLSSISIGFSSIGASVAKASTQMKNFHLNTRNALMSLAALAGGAASGNVNSASTIGGVMGNAATTAGVTFAATGNPLLAGLGAIGSFGGSIYNALTGAWEARDEANKSIEENKLRNEYNLRLANAYRSAMRTGERAGLESAMSEYSKKYGDEAARRMLYGLAGMDYEKEMSDEAKGKVVNVNNVNSNNTTQNNSISANIGEIASLLRSTIDELLDSRVRFESAALSEVASI